MTDLALPGWKDCSLYGASTYTCDLVEVDTAEQAEAAQAAILQEIKACLGQGWSEADGRSSPSHVVLHSALRPVSITLSMDATDNKNSCRAPHRVYPQKVGGGDDRIGHQHPRSSRRRMPPP